MYIPKLARFTARDPLPHDEAILIGGRSEHSYAYANSNPVNQIDPSGLVAITFLPKQTSSHPWSFMQGLRSPAATRFLKEHISCECYECLCHEFTVKCRIDIQLKILIRSGTSRGGRPFLYAHEQRHVESIRAWVDRFVIPRLESAELPCLSYSSEEDCKAWAKDAETSASRIYEMFKSAEEFHRSPFWRQYPNPWVVFPVLGTMPPVRPFF